MRLLKCHIENFGKLHDLTIDLSGSPVVINEKNGSGKSTLASFIKVMFYGFANEKKRGDALDRERSFFRPWQGGVYGGELEFEAGGKRYRMNRIFGAKEADDTFALYDADTNLASADFSASIGEELFQINQESFLRTIYIAQNDCATATTDSINAKIGNLADNLDDINNYEKVQQVLKDLKNSLTPFRKTGSLRKLKNEIDELKNGLRRRETVERSMAELQDRIARCNQEKEEILDGQKALQDELLARRNELTEQMEELRGEAAKYRFSADEETEAAELEARFRGNPVREDDIEYYLRQWDICSEIRGGLESKRAALATLMAAEEQAAQAARAREDARRRRLGALLIFSVSLILMGAALYFLMPAAGIAVAAAGAVMATVSLAARAAGGSRRGVGLPEDDGAADLAEEIAEDERALVDAQDGVLRFLEDRGYGGAGEDRSARDILRAMKNDLRRYQRFQERRRDYLERGFDRRMEELEAELRGLLGSGCLGEEIRERLERNSDSRNSYLTGLDELQQELEQLEADAERLAGLEEQYEKGYRYYCDLELVSDFLARAKESFSARYMGPIMNAFRAYYEDLSRISGEDFRIDANIRITKKEAGEQRDIRAFSAGSRDLIGIAQRMALIDAMYRKEKPFLIFDDPFTNLDGEKLAYARQFLQNIAGKYQVIYFTCHESRAV